MDDLMHYGVGLIENCECGGEVLFESNQSKPPKKIQHDALIKCSQCNKEGVAFVDDGGVSPDWVNE